MLLEAGLQQTALAVLFVAPAVMEKIREDRLHWAGGEGSSGLTASQGQSSANGAGHGGLMHARPASSPLAPEAEVGEPAELEMQIRGALRSDDSCHISVIHQKERDGAREATKKEKQQLLHLSAETIRIRPQRNTLLSIKNDRRRNK
ncbi:hypothetical protein MHYP_G00134150 [Metynnis hypsauchen]